MVWTPVIAVAGSLTAGVIVTVNFWVMPSQFSTGRLMRVGFLAGVLVWMGGWFSGSSAVPSRLYSRASPFGSAKKREPWRGGLGS